MSHMMVDLAPSLQKVGPNENCTRAVSGQSEQEINKYLHDGWLKSRAKSFICLIFNGCIFDVLVTEKHFGAWLALWES